MKLRCQGKKNPNDAPCAKMKVYHILVEQSDDWLAAHALEDDSIHTQGKTLNEITANIREVLRTWFAVITTFMSSS